MSDVDAPKPDIKQQAENSTRNCVIQAVRGENNIQLQGDSKLVILQPYLQDWLLFQLDDNHQIFQVCY